MADDQRSIILETLLAIEKSDTGSNRIVKDVLDKYSYLDKQKRSFIMRAIQGTQERQLELDYIIDQYSKIKTNKLKPVIRVILRMSVYQLMYMDSVPAGAVCNEAVKLAVKKGFGTLKGYVNGVLRTISRNKDNIPYPDKADYIKYLMVKYSTPEWLVKMIISDYGNDNAELILRSTLDNDNLYIRVNQSKVSVDELKNKLAEEGIITEAAPYIPYALKVNKIDSISKSKSFNEGLFQVQDLSSMLCVHCAGINKADEVLDICAAPGGKTIHVLDLLNGSGHVVSRDISEQKISLIAENVGRCGFSKCAIQVADATVYDESIIDKFDVVICDLPCSGLGITGRKNDIKYRMTPEQMDELVVLQRKILSVAYKYVKQGGILMFSTCTINRAENHENVKWIEDNLPLKAVPLDDVLPSELVCETTKDGFLQLTMGLHECDGFFISKFKRI